MEATHSSDSRPTDSPERIALAGARDMAPIAAGVAPFGVALGALLSSSALGDAAGLAGSVLIGSGVAQLAAMQSFDAGNAVPVAATAGLVVNARLVVYGAALGPWFRHESKRMRRLLAAFIIDPMLATGGSTNAAIDLLKKAGAGKIVVVCIVTCPEGLELVADAHPDVPVYTAAIDDHLNDNKYIVPGLGDAGDRLFGTSH